MASKLEYRANWDNDDEHLVFFGDIMGFKNLIATKNHSEMNKIMKRFWDDVDTKSSPLIGPDLRMMRFSDSVILVTKGCSDRDLNKLTKAITRLMQLSFRMKLPIKGAIAKGKLTLDEERQLVFGQALVDAYLLEEELYYYGVAIHHSIEPLVKKNLAHQPYHLITLPMKSGNIPHYQLSYHKMSYSLDKKDITATIMDQLDSIQSEVSCRPRIYIQNTRNVIKGVNKMLEEVPTDHSISSSDSAVS